MRRAYALLGILFLIVLGGAYFAVDRAYAPELLPEEGSMLSDNQESMSLTLTSPAFADNGTIPTRYTCDGENVQPELRIGNVPEGTQSLVLVMDDPDIPDSVKQSRGIKKFDHLVLYNIPPTTTVIPENTSMGTEGINGAGDTGYIGPCPPDREHRYIFRLYALSGTINFIKAPTLDDVETAAKGIAISSAELVGRYDRTK